MAQRNVVVVVSYDYGLASTDASLQFEEATEAFSMIGFEQICDGGREQRHDQVHNIEDNHVGNLSKLEDLFNNERS